MKLPPNLLRDHPLVSFRAFSALWFAGCVSWGVAPGYYISRLWRFQTKSQRTPGGRVSDPKCLVTRERQSLNARNDVAKFDVFSCLRLSFEELHYAVGHFLAKSNAIGQPDQICVLKLDSRALVTIVKQGLQSGTLQVAI